VVEAQLPGTAFFLGHGGRLAIQLRPGARSWLDVILLCRPSEGSVYRIQPDVRFDDRRPGSSQGAAHLAIGRSSARRTTIEVSCSRTFTTLGTLLHDPHGESTLTVQPTALCHVTQGLGQRERRAYAQAYLALGTEVELREVKQAEYCRAFARFSQKAPL